MKSREQFRNPLSYKLLRLRLFFAVVMLLIYIIFSQETTHYGHLIVGAGFLLYTITLITGFKKKPRLLSLLSLAGEAVLTQTIAAMTGIYTSPFLFLFLLSPYIQVLTNGPRWAWYSFFVYLPFLSFALVTAARYQEWKWTAYTAAIIILLLAETDTIFRLERSNKDLINKANHDPLTNLVNRHALEEICAGIENGFGREVCTMAMLDLDNFKRYNDLFGHLEGDRLLKKVADVLQESMRGDDLVLRYGGDEFLIVLWGTNREESLKVIKRIKDRVWEKARCRVTSGTATAFVKKRSDFMDLLHHADQELFTKKKENKRAEAKLQNYQ